MKERPISADVAVHFQARELRLRHANLAEGGTEPGGNERLERLLVLPNVDDTPAAVHRAGRVGQQAGGAVPFHVEIEHCGVVHLGRTTGDLEHESNRHGSLLSLRTYARAAKSDV